MSQQTDITPVVVVFGIAGLGYLAVTQGWLSSIFPSTATTPASQPTASGVNPGTIMKVTPPTTTTTQPPAAPAGPTPQSLQAQVAGLSLGNALLKVAGVDSNTKLTVDEWNYYLTEIWPTAYPDDLSSQNIVRGQNDSMLVANYVFYRQQAHDPDPTQAGVSGLGAFQPHSRIPAWIAHRSRA